MSKVEQLTPINASYGGINKLNAHLDKIETAFQNTLSRDGSAPNFMGADIDMNSQQLINLGDPTLEHHAATKSYVDTLAFGGEITIALPDVTSRTTSKTTLKAIALPTAETAVIVEYNTAHGDRWGGIFVWRSGNRASSVTADPLEAIWVAPSAASTGSSGAWERLRDGAYAKAAWFGVRGDSGTTSNTPTMFQQMEDTCNSLSIKQIRYEEYNYYWSDTIKIRRSLMGHRGMGVSQTIFTFNHTNNGIQYGDDGFYSFRPEISGIGYQQASGTAYAHYVYCAREVSIGDYIRGSDVRNFLKIGAERVLVTNITNNGSGLIRVTVGSAQTWATGTRMAVTQVDGNASLVAALAAIQFTITRISSTEFDLQGTTFAGAYTTGGAMAPFTLAVELSNGPFGDNMKVRDRYYVNVTSLAGNLNFIGYHVVENPARTAGSVGVYYSQDTSAYERMDFTGGDHVYLRRFEKGVFKDNCRLVSMRILDLALDECTTPFEIVDDDAAAETQGTEEIVIGKFRVGSDPTALSATSLRIKATTSVTSEVSIGQFNAIGTGTAIELIGGTGGTNGVYHFRVADALCELRPITATTSDAITISGYVEAMFGSVVGRSGFGAGTERDVFRFADDFLGAVTIGNIQMQNLSGYGVTVGAAVVAATADIVVGDITNATTPANRISDTANIARVNMSPRRGSATYDPANLVDGAGVTTTVTVTGAALGDVAQASFSLDLQGITLTAWVSAANTVSVRFQNETGGAIDLASGTLRATARPLT